MADRFPELPENDLTSQVDQKNSENTRKQQMLPSTYLKGTSKKERKIDEESLVSLERQVGNCSEKFYTEAENTYGKQTW